MKKILSAICLSIVALSASAQTREFSLTAGLNIPMDSGVESGAVYRFNYATYSTNGIGFRAGLQWSPDVADVNNVVGIPLAFVYRTHSRSRQERLATGAYGAAYTAFDSAFRGEKDIYGSVLGALIVNLFSEMEFFFGITPGHIIGDSSPVSEASWGSSPQVSERRQTVKNSAWFLTMDAGFCLNYSLWRVDIKLMPTFHYNFIDSLIYTTSREDGEGVTRTNSTPLRQFISLSIGLSYNF